MHLPIVTQTVLMLDNSTLLICVLEMGYSKCISVIKYLRLLRLLWTLHLSNVFRIPVFGEDGAQRVQANHTKPRKEG